MMHRVFTPPLKCQGIKTKLVGAISHLATRVDYDTWVEPFCGSCVVPLNIRPKKALLCDTNEHIIRFYSDVQSGAVTPASVRQFLMESGERLRKEDEDCYYEFRERFNAHPDSHTFLFLNRSCFNGVMRFNRRGKFNVPFCRKPDRFSQAYITKIANQFRSISTVIASLSWQFRAQDFRETFKDLEPTSVVYADPPYMGRHVDYFNTWTEQDETDLAAGLKALPCRFILSTWHSNEFRDNPFIERFWSEPRFHVVTHEHFYHVGSTEDLRHPMIEALITNYPPTSEKQEESVSVAEQMLFL
ncbi:MAG: Dam family site-specific DNA-(adenine-N6)-methyltransferase [Candidatus Sumerlaeota bacterium]|nr:Dam family site-specific DNA-(adenine-N6)-methyltransferase [Candidatus Sumerlaeota bacterium]